MENTLFDNLLIFDSALDETQVRDIASRAAAMPTDHAFDNLNDLQDLEILVKEVKNYYEEANSDALTNAYNYAERVLNSSNQAMKRRRYQQLLDAVADYQQQEWDKAAAGEPANLTFLITNSSFTRYNIGWQGVHIPTSGNYAGYADETAEQFSRPFDLYQVLEGMPAGTYTLTCNAFYRAGAIEAAYAAWLNAAPETQYAQIYINDVSAPLLNLYSCDTYTYDPYRYPDNLSAASTAFNSRHLYGGNTVSFHLESDGQPLRIGIRKLTTVPYDWTAYDHFQLHYQALPTAVHPQHTSTSPVVRTEYFDPAGRAMNAKYKGIVIRRQTHADGSVTVKKILRNIE